MLPENLPIVLTSSDRKSLKKNPPYYELGLLVSGKIKIKASLTLVSKNLSVIHRKNDNSKDHYEIGFDLG